MTVRDDSALAAEALRCHDLKVDAHLHSARCVGVPHKLSLALERGDKVVVPRSLLDAYGAAADVLSALQDGRGDAKAVTDALARLAAAKAEAEAMTAHHTNRRPDMMDTTHDAGPAAKAEPTPRRGEA